MVISQVQIQVLLLILARIIGLFLVAPFFSNKSIASTYKMTFIFMFAFLLWFVVPFTPQKLSADPFLYIISLGNEFIIGLLLGSVVNFIFNGIEAAGELMGAQMGLSVASMLDPSTGAQTTITTRILQMIVLMIFLIVDGHHFLLTALYKSYEVLPMLYTWNLGNGAREVANMATQIFAIGIQLSAPILLTVFLLDFAFGLISRVAPQVNVFQLGFQMKPVLGVFVLMLMIPLLLERMVWLINMMIEKLTYVMLYLRR
jgi:flagellar biosynthesis protein FliR